MTKARNSKQLRDERVGRARGILSLSPSPNLAHQGRGEMEKFCQVPISKRYDLEERIYRRKGKIVFDHLGLDIVWDLVLRASDFITV